MKERKHPAFEANEQLLHFYLDSFLGGDSYITPKNLHKHRLESVGDYRVRLKRAYYLNYVSSVVKVYTQYVCPTSMPREVVKKDDAEYFEKFADNCTGDGTDLATFIRDISDNAGVCGYAGVIVDGTQILENAPEVATGAFDKAAPPPLLRKVLATQLVDWSVDSGGQYNWVLIKTAFMVDSDPDIERKMFDRYELWDRTSLRIFMREKGSKDEELVLKETKAHNLGIVPFCLFIHSRALLDGIPASQIKDIALVNRAIFNYASNLDEIVAQQTFSQLLMPELEEGETNERLVGTRRVLTYNALSNTAPGYIAPPSGPAEVIMRWIQVLIAEIFRMAVVRKSGAATTDQYSTAYGKAVDFEDTEAALREKADLMESNEYNLSVIVNAWRGQKSSRLWTPLYPKTFDVRALTETLADALQFDALNMGDEFMNDLKMLLVRMQFPNITNERALQILKSIKEATQLDLEMSHAELDSLSAPDSLDGLGNPKKDKNSPSRPQESGTGS